MRLSDILSKKPTQSFEQVDGFLIGKQGKTGQQVKLEVGKIALNYYCNKCEDLRTFYSTGKLTCIFVNPKIVSIDSVLSCNCGSSVEVWFIIESSPDDDITSSTPKVRILKRSERLPENVQFNAPKYKDFDCLLDKARLAYQENLGAGAIVYLRKIFEIITVNVANANGIDFAKYSEGNPKNFSALLKIVDDKCGIIPKEFSENKQQLFKELSNIVHGDFNEEIGLKKFEHLQRLIIGILENMQNKTDFKDAEIALGWINNDGVK